MSFWELKLCDCGSVNNKLFKNIYPGFDAFMGRTKKYITLSAWAARTTWKFFPFQAVCHIQPLSFDARKPTLDSANQRRATSGCGLMWSWSQSRRSDCSGEAGLER